MPKKPPALPAADDFPEIEVDDELDIGVADDLASLDRLSAESDVSDSLQDISASSFEDAPKAGPLDFHDGAEMGHHRN